MTALIFPKTPRFEKKNLFSDSLLVIPVFIPHRGCPHLCLFCNQQSIIGSTAGAGEPVVHIAGEIDVWLKRSPGHITVQVAFYGGSFTCLPRQEQAAMLAMVQPYLQDGRVDAIRLSTRPDCVTPEIARFLRMGGVEVVELGVQSLDDQVLRQARRGHTAQESRQAIQWLKEAGLQVGVQLLPGLPGESTRSFLTGVREVVELAPALVRLYPTVVVEQSGLAQLYRQGGYRPLSLNKAIALTRRAKEMFDAAGIPVVRMGLQPSVSLASQVVAGPYHPAFGELVVARGWFREIRGRLSTLAPGEVLRIHISDRDYSAVVGLKKMNIQRLENLGFKGRFTLVAEKKRERGSVEYVVS